MAAIRPVDLPDGTVTNTGVTIVDTGSNVVKATPQQLIDAAVPLATQAEAEAGVNNTKRVSPLRVTQAIDARKPTTGVASLAALKAASTATAVRYNGSTYDFLAGDYTGQADDLNIVKADSTSLSAGAWVRQKTSGLLYKPSTPATARSAEDVFNDTKSLATYIRATEGADQTAAFARAFADIDISGGRGTRLLIPDTGVLTTTAPITIPAGVTLASTSNRSAIINSTAAGDVFRIRNSYSGLERLRIGLVGSAGVVQTAVSVETAAQSIQFWTLSRLQIAGNGTVGKRGLYVSTPGGLGQPIIADGSISHLQLLELDRPITAINSEGNHWTDLIIDQFGYDTVSPPAAMDMTTLAEKHFLIRIAGAGVANRIGYKQAGVRNEAALNVDIGANGCTAINLAAGGRNIVSVTRPELLTPLGTAGNTNSVFDPDGFIIHRSGTQGSMPSASNFALSAAWGSAATVNVLAGSDDSGVQFVVNSSGTGQAANPTIGYVFADGAWPTPKPKVQPTRDGGSQPTVGSVGTSSTTTGWGFTWPGTPVDGESYTFIVTVR